MISFNDSIEADLIELSKKRKIFLEGNLVKVVETESEEFLVYLQQARERDIENRKRRLSITKQVQRQNNELIKKQSENENLMSELHKALEEAEAAQWEAERLKHEALEGKEKALEDLELIQKKSQFELINIIVRVALYVIVGVGFLTTVMYIIAIAFGKETQIVGSTWSNMFGILLTNAFSIVGTIMGVKYANDSLKKE